MSLVFVSTGTVSFPFKRLVDAIIEFYKDKPMTNVVIQSGDYKIKAIVKHIEIHPYFPLEKMIKFYKSADLIISAAGEASVFLILKYAKHKPIIIPRLKKYEEHVDDQQFLVANYLKKKKLAYTLLDRNKLKTMLKKHRLKLAKKRKTSLKTSSELARLIKNLNQLTAGL